MGSRGGITSSRRRRARSPARASPARVIWLHSPDLTLPCPQIKQLKQQVVQQQLFDGPAWEQVVLDLKALNVVGDDTRAAFEALLEFMPSAVRGGVMRSREQLLWSS